MYIGGTDDRAYHHMAAEIVDNAMDEAVAGHAGRIEIALKPNNTLTVKDNGRGIPVDPHPKFKDKSALEVILTMLHSGASFPARRIGPPAAPWGRDVGGQRAFRKPGGGGRPRSQTLRAAFLPRQGQGSRRDLGPTQNRRGTTVTFKPDPRIFGEPLPSQTTLPHGPVQGLFVSGSGDPLVLRSKSPQGRRRHPGNRRPAVSGRPSRFLINALENRKTITAEPFDGKTDSNAAAGHVEWAAAWPRDEDGFFNSYCNTVPTPQGGAMKRLPQRAGQGLRAYGDLVNEGAAKITADDVVGGACLMLSVFIPDPQFQGQTKEKLSPPTPSAWWKTPFATISITG